MAPAATILNVAVTYVDAPRPGAVRVRARAGRRAHGVVFHDDWDALGMRASASGSVSFEDVRIGRRRRCATGSRPATYSAALPRALPGLRCVPRRGVARDRRGGARQRRRRPCAVASTGSLADPHAVTELAAQRRRPGGDAGLVRPGRAAHRRVRRRPTRPARRRWRRPRRSSARCRRARRSSPRPRCGSSTGRWRSAAAPATWRAPAGQGVAGRPGRRVHAPRRRQPGGQPPRPHRPRRRPRRIDRSAHRAHAGRARRRRHRPERRPRRRAAS